jgi:hypothetical protein
MKEVNGKDPVNARIRINYSGKKPKVSFSYPEKKNQFRGSMFPFIFFGWLLMNIPLLIYFNYSFNHLPDLSTYEQWVEYRTSEEYLKESFMKYHSPIKTIFSKEFLRILLLIPYFFGIPFLIYRPFKKKWDKLFPDVQAFLSRKYYRTFKPGDVVEKDGEYYVELPVFSNIVCDFKATKDFSKYIKEFEIEEYKFYYKKFKKGKHRKKKNEWIWYARWYFTHPIKKGVLDVTFK